MFKASIQRQARLSGVARRHLSTVSLSASALRPACRAASAAVAHSPVFSAVSTLPRVAALRCYSGSAAQAQDSEKASSSGAVTRFDDLDRLGVHPNLINGLTQGLGYEKMTDVQSMTINAALNGKDLVAQAKTGTGKTLAFLVPIFQRMIAADPALADKSARRLADVGDIRGIIMSPTRELAEQIGAEAKKLSQYTGIKVQTAVGGTRKREALARMQREGCHLLVATPGRCFDLLSDPSTGVAAPRLSSFVLDEADRMLDVGFTEELRDIQGCLPNIRDVDRQTLLFSATIPRNVVHLAKSMVKVDNFEFVQTIRENDSPTHERIPQNVVAVDGYEHLYPCIMEIADKAVKAARQDPEVKPFKAIIFFSNTTTVKMAYDILRSCSSLFGRSGMPIFDIHSGLDQSQRTRNANAFRQSSSSVLVSSDVTARGMDFPNVTHVIQVGLPPDREQYIHRVGRTGRAGKSGEGWLLLAHDEIPEARQRLPGLPIKPNNTLASAKTSTSNEDTSRYQDQLAKAYSWMSAKHWPDVYMTLINQRLGRVLRRSSVVELVNNWSKAIGWQEPPAIPRDESYGDRRFGSAGGDRRSGGSSFGQQRSRPRTFEDQFASKTSDRSRAPQRAMF